MTTRPKKQKLTETEGILYVASVINKHNCVFNKIDGGNDIGLDGYLEFIEKESATGLCIGVQIKSGDSYSKTKNSAIIPADKEHFLYWSEHTLPIAGLVFIASENSAYWVDITSFLKANPSVVENGPYQIPVPKDSVFSVETFQTFFKAFKNYKVTFNEDWNFGRCLRALSTTEQPVERFDALKSLFHFHRNQLATWHFIIQQFRTEKDDRILEYIIYLLGHLTGHGDVHWHSGNIIQTDISLSARSLITEWFAIPELLKLIQGIDDESGLSRGTMGQNIHAICSLIKNRIEHLKKIILDKGTDDSTRRWAAILLIDYFQSFDPERALNFANSMIDNFPKSDFVEHFEVIKETLAREEYVDFIG